MKNKILLGLLTFCLVFTALVACTMGRDDSSTEETVENTVEETTEEVTTDSDDSSDDILADRPTIEFNHESLELESDYFSASYVTAEVTSDGYSALKDGIKEAFTQLEVDFEATAAEYVEECNTANEENEEYIWYYMYQKATLARCDNNIVSIVIDESVDFGGAHGGDIYYTLIFDTKTGEQLNHLDMGITVDEITSYVINYLSSNEIFDEGLYEDYENTIIDMVADNQFSGTYYLDGQGLEIVFQEYDIAPYAAGVIKVLIPYSEFSSFKEEYLPTDEFYTVDLLDYWADKSFDIDGDGQEEEIGLSFIYDDSYEYYSDVILTVGDEELSLMGLDYWHEDYTGEYVHCNGYDYVFVHCYDANDWETTIVCSITDGIGLTQNLEGGVENINPDGVVLSTRKDILGTWGVIRNYSFAADGDGIVADNEGDDCYTIVLSDDVDEEYNHITVAKEFTAKDGSTVEVGTKLYPLYTNGVDLIAFEDESGSLVEITVEKPEDDYQWYIDGVSEYDIFENLPYAG